METNAIMKRLFVASLMSLAIAGCAQSRSALSKGDSALPGPAAPGPVAVTPIPSIYDTVNPGMGGPALARTAMANPNDPRWSGRASAPGTAAPAASRPANPASGASPAPAQSLDPSSAAPAELSLQPARSGQPVAGAAPAAASPAVPAGTELPAAAMPGVAPAPADPVRTTSAGPAPSDAGAMPADSRAAATRPPAGSPAGADVIPSASPSSLTSVAEPALPPPVTPAAAPPNPGPRHDRDPLLGPDPDLLPPMPDLPAVKSSGRSAASSGPDLPAVKSPGSPPPLAAPEAPAAKSGSSAPPPLAAPEAPAARSSTSVPPPLEGLPIEAAPPAAPAAANPPIEPAVSPKTGAGPARPDAKPADSDKSTAAIEPASAGSLAALLPLEKAPAPDNVSRAVSARAAVPGPAPAPVHRDPQVARASAEMRKGDPTDRRRLVLEPGCPIARVGDEIITYHDLVLATRESLSKYSLPRGKEFDTQHQIEMANQINMLKIDALEGLIERSMLYQEAKHHIKDPKVLDRINEEADRIWHDNEILPLQREYNVDSEQQLKERLASRGRSLDSMRQSFRQLYLSRSFLHEKLRDRVNVELPDLLKYYEEHRAKHEFDRSARITWRELVVEVPKYQTREAARRKAEGLLKSLQQGEEFAKLARAQSDGLASSRNRGGLMETSPGGYAVAAVNRAIESLPVGQVSGLIDGPESFHIVKVEARRAAGAASFEEVQDKIKPIVQNEKFQTESAAYINKLRRSTPITIYSPKKTKKTNS